MIRAGHERTRRNLRGTWALRRSQPLVTLGSSGLPRTLGGPAGPVNGVVHSSDIDVPSYPQSVHRGRLRRPPQPVVRPVAGSSAVSWPPKLVRTSRPPTSSAAVTTSEWAIRQATTPSGSMANVSISAWTTTWAERAAPGLEPVGVEAVADDQQAGRIPVQGARVVVDHRREADRPGAPRTLEPELGPAQGFRVVGDERSEVDQLATGFRQREDLATGAAPAPPPAATQAAWVDNGRVARLGAHRRHGAGQAPTFWGVSAAAGSSAIGVTVALARFRSVAGGTGKTAVDSPAAAHTTW